MLALADVVAVGTDAVMIVGEDVLVTADDAPPDMETAAKADVLRDEVITESGRKLGIVRDVIILGGVEPRVVGFEVDDGPIGRGLIPLAAATAMSASALIVPDSFEARMRQDLMGLAAELSLIEQTLR